MFKILGSKLSV